MIVDSIKTVISNKIWQLSFLLVIIFIVFSYNYIDITVAEYFHSLKGSEFYNFCKKLTHAGDGHWYIVPALILYLIWRKRNAVYAKAALFIFATTLSAGIIVDLLKIIFGRFRPKLYFNEGLYGIDWFHIEAVKWSFPSGHATTVMGAWLAFGLLFPKYKIPFLILGTTLALTRVFVTKHYMSDIVAGGFLGITVTLVCYHLLYGEKKEI